jgi:IS30 family transposase
MTELTFAERVALDYVDEEECEQLCQMHADGMTFKEITMITGRHRTTIHRHLRGECDHA